MAESRRPSPQWACRLHAASFTAILPAQGDIDRLVGGHPDYGQMFRPKWARPSQ